MKTALILFALLSGFAQAQTAAPTPVQLVVEFHIPAGTGSNAWNTEATAVQVKLGQVLRIFNDDTVSHRLHTEDSAPCPHGSDFAPGKTFDCVIGKPFQGARYDHAFGPTAAFYIDAQ